MLVLNRKVGQAFTIGDNIRIIVVEVRGGVARIGIEADKSIPIVRDDAINPRPRRDMEGKTNAAV